MLNSIARNWWVVALRGIAGIVFGIGAFVWPGVTLAALVLVFGAYVFVDGVIAVVAGLGMRRTLGRWWLIVLEGVAGIILGVLTLFAPDATALVIVIYVAVWSIITGVFEIVTALGLRKMIENEWVLIVPGGLSTVFGVLLTANPAAGALSLVWLLGSYVLLFGLLALILAFRLRGLRGAGRQHAAGMA